MMGKPVIRGTRITVELILRKLARSANEGELLKDYPHLTTEELPGSEEARQTNKFWSAHSMRNAYSSRGSGL